MSHKSVGFLQVGLLLINIYSKHMYWIFIRGLSRAEVCLCAAARTGISLQVASRLCGRVDSRRVNAACAAGGPHMRSRESYYLDE